MSRCENTSELARAEWMAAEERAALDAHVAECDACRDGRAALARARSVLVANRTAPTPAQLVALRSGVAARTERRGWVPLVAFGVATAAAAAVFLLPPEPPARALVEGRARVADRTLSPGDALPASSRIALERGSIARADEANAEAIEPSTLSLEPQRVRLASGLVRFDVAPRRSGETFVVVTPLAEIRVVGTRFSVAVRPDETAIAVDEGTVEVRAAKTEPWRLEAGDRVTIRPAAETHAARATRDRDAVASARLGRSDAKGARAKRGAATQVGTGADPKSKRRAIVRAESERGARPSARVKRDRRAARKPRTEPTRGARSSAHPRSDRSVTTKSRREPDRHAVAASHAETERAADANARGEPGDGAAGSHADDVRDEVASARGEPDRDGVAGSHAEAVRSIAADSVRGADAAAKSEPVARAHATSEPEPAADSGPGPAAAPDELMRLADARRRAGAFAAAALLYARVASSGDKLAEEAALRHAEVLRLAGDRGGALRVLESASASGRFAPERAALAARIHVESGEPERAAAVLARADASSYAVRAARLQTARAVLEDEPALALEITKPLLDAGTPETLRTRALRIAIRVAHDLRDADAEDVYRAAYEKLLEDE